MKREPIERTGGAYEADPKTGKLKRTEEPTRMPEPEPAPVDEQPEETPAPAIPPASAETSK